MLLAPLLLLLLCLAQGAVAAEAASEPSFPPPLSSYGSSPGASLLEVLQARVRAEPFNLVATILFFLAITHTFMAPVFTRLSHRAEREHQERLAKAGQPLNGKPADEVSFKAEILHFFGEVEVIFGLWIIPLLLALTFAKGWPTARDYVGHTLNFTEPLFVVAIMTIAASRPILKLSEQVMSLVACLGKGSPAAWWLSILTVGPLLGSFITEPAAMTISALLLAANFYRLVPSPALAYATLGLLFVNVSVGGTLTHFAAPPVLMVAGKWGWGFREMLVNFGWKAAAGIVLANLLYWAWFRKEFKALAVRPREPEGTAESRPIPVWITCVHVLFLVWTVMNTHSPALFIGGLLFFVGFTHATEHHQSELALRPALLVGFFLAGLIVHGGLQGWWLQPVLSGLSEQSLFFGAAALTAFNDNAAITFFASLVPGFTDSMKYAVMAGAVTGGGLTVIANAPNPAGQSILSRFFPDGISGGRLFLGALIPTVIMTAAFLILR